ncbi:MoaD/ThiS family protein [Hydrogenobaculum acidophilum]
MKLLYFSILKERLGAFEEIEFEGNEAHLKEYLCKKYPALCDIIKSCRFAKENEYASEFKNDDTVLVIPPVSGG